MNLRGARIAALGVLAWAATTLAGAGVVAAQPRPMSIVDLIELPYLGDPQISPDGELVVFELGEADWKENRRRSHLWAVEVATGAARQLTFGDKDQENPRFSPDGAWIAFLTERGDDEHPQIYLLPRAGGEAHRLVEHATAPGEIAWSTDGESLFFVAAEPKSDEEKKREKAKDDVVAFDEDYKQRHLWLVSVADGSERRLTEGDFSIRGYRLSRDGSSIVYHRAPTPLFDDSDEGEVWIMAADGSGGRQLTDNAVPEHGGELSPDGETVLFLAAANERFESYYNDNLFLVPSGGGAHRLLLPDLPYEMRDAHWSDNGEAIYFTANTGVRSELFRLEVATGELAQLTRGDHALRAWRYDEEHDRHLLSFDRPDNAGDVWLLDDGEIRQVSHLYDDLATTYRLPRQEAITWTGDDGQTVEGLLYYPLDEAPGHPYPLVVQTHGGPASSDQFEFGRWNDYVQVLTARGWLVFKPNYRGSTGYGDAYLRDMVGHYFRQAHLDVMAGVEHLIDLGLADGSRMVKMGWSAGGHMTNKIITFTDRFKAASSGAGAVNWISMYGQSDVRIYRTPWFGGTPWQKNAPIETYWSNSPLKDVWKVKTPTLVLVGEEDVRVPPPQSVELYRALKSNGVPTHLYMAPREPHGWRELRHELFKVNVELEWFERWALGRDYTWETAPADAEGATSEDGETTGEAAE